MPPTRLSFNPRRHERLASVRDHDDIARLEVRRGVLEEAEILAGCVVKAIDRHRAVTIKNTRCKEVGASGFRCITNYDTEGVGTYEVWLWVKPRPAGGLCVSPSSLRWVPSGCLANGRRARGSIRDAYSAFRRKIRISPMKKGDCIGHGSGFYSCHVKDSTGLYRASVTFAPAPVVRVLS